MHCSNVPDCRERKVPAEWPGDADGLRMFRDLPWTPNRRVGDLRNVAFVGNYNGIEFDNRISLRDHIRCDLRPQRKALPDADGSEIVDLTTDVNPRT
jgi:hypothetical protein